jgi:Ni/Co efflux regulator RcnB
MKEFQMIGKTAISLAIALAMTSGSFAFAKDNGKHDRNDRSDHRNDRDNQAWKQQGLHDNRNFGRSHNEHRKHGRGVGPNHEYYRGDRLPADYRHNHYVVNDWRGHQLSAPPRGHHWVQSGNDYVLIAIATGLIATVLLNN